MNHSLKTLAKSLLARTPYRIVRGGPNRFDAAEYNLKLLRTMGYDPRAVIDGGAHTGEFSKMVAALFPLAKIHMIEPQPACQPALQTLASAQGYTLHPYALSAKPSSELRMWASNEPSTGACIAEPDAPGLNTVAITGRTLDELFATLIAPSDRAFIKLDLQGYELEALSGGTALLKAAEVVQVEVSFFRQAYEPPIPALLGFFDDNQYELFDIVGLYGRARDGRLRQGDFIFVRRGSPLLADGRWA